MTARQAILTELLARLSAIAISNGYITDAGVGKVYVGETPILGSDDPAVAIAVLVRDDIPTDVSGRAGGDGRTVTVLPIDVQAIAKADLDQPWMTVEAVLADIRQAIETDDRDLGQILTMPMMRGKTKTFPRDGGSPIVGSATEYRFTFDERWGG